VLQSLERLHGERQRIAAVRLESIEIGLPRLDASRREERFPQVLVRCDIPGIARKDAPIRSNGRIRRALLR
jgi:hypothetical protein